MNKIIVYTSLTVIIIIRLSDFRYLVSKMGYSEEEKLEIIRLYYKNNNNVAQTQAEYWRLLL